jgi:lipid-A-disaccharide synthase
MECAFFGVPTVTLYKTSWFTYRNRQAHRDGEIADDAEHSGGEEVYPEFIQNAATPENISRAALELLQDESRRQNQIAARQNCFLARRTRRSRARGGRRF